MSGRFRSGSSLADGRRLERHPEEQRVLARLRELREAGHSLRAVAVALNREGCVARGHGRWYHQYVALQLARSEGIGVTVHAAGALAEGDDEQ